MGVSKNSKMNRGKGATKRVVRDEKNPDSWAEVTPVLYYGRSVGHGRYMTGSVNGVTVVDAKGKPVPLRQIGKLEAV